MPPLIRPPQRFIHARSTPTAAAIAATASRPESGRLTSTWHGMMARHFPSPIFPLCCDVMRRPSETKWKQQPAMRVQTQTSPSRARTVLQRGATWVRCARKATWGWMEMPIPLSFLYIPECIPCIVSSVHTRSAHGIPNRAFRTSAIRKMEPPSSPAPRSAAPKRLPVLELGTVLYRVDDGGPVLQTHTDFACCCVVTPPGVNPSCIRRCHALSALEPEPGPSRGLACP